MENFNWEIYKKCPNFINFELKFFLQWVRILPEIYWCHYQGACPAPMWKIHMEGHSIFIHIPPFPNGILPKKKYKYTENINLWNNFILDNLFSFVPAHVCYHHSRICHRLGYQPRFKLQSTWGSILTHKKWKIIIF